MTLITEAIVIDFRALKDGGDYAAIDLQAYTAL